MLKIIWNTLKELAASKKAVVAVVAALAWIAGRAGLDVDKAELTGALGPLWAFVFGQGLADIGKEKAKIEAQGTVL